MRGTVLDLVDAGITKVVMPSENAALPPVRSEPLLDALTILRRLVDGLSEQYDERECPNGQPPCGMCKLVTEAKAFLSANSPICVNEANKEMSVK